MKKTILFSGNSNIALARDVAKILQVEFGEIIVDRFSDQETRIQLLTKVTNKNVLILQSTSPPVNENLMDLLLIADAIYRANALSITAIIPYFGYARQNHLCRLINKEPLSSEIVIKMLELVKINNILTIDLHSEQIKPLFNGKWINLYISEIIAGDLLNQQLSEITIVSPDLGSKARTKSLLEFLKGKLKNIEIAMIIKNRNSNEKIIISKSIDNIYNKHCILVDDIADTGNTICTAANFLKGNGASKVTAYCTHAILSGEAIQNLNNSELDKIIVTNTVLLECFVRKCKKIRVLSVASILANALRTLVF